MELPNDALPVPIMEMSADISEIAKALPKAQAAMGEVFKKATNPAFRSKYADLSSVVDAVVPAFNESGVTLLQPSSFDGEFVRVATMLLHESGQWVRCTLAIRPSKPDAHGIGSAVTYARRYGLQAMSGVAPEDDDGNAASGPREARQAPQRDTVGRPRLSSAEAKRQGLHDAFKADLESVTDPDVLDTWIAQMLPKHKSQVPLSWLEAMDDQVESHRNALVEKRREEA